MSNPKSATFARSSGSFFAKMQRLRLLEGMVLHSGARNLIFRPAYKSPSLLCKNPDDLQLFANHPGFFNGFFLNQRIRRVQKLYFPMKLPFLSKLHSNFQYFVFRPYRTIRLPFLRLPEQMVRYCDAMLRGRKERR